MGTGNSTFEGLVGDRKWGYYGCHHWRLPLKAEQPTSFQLNGAWLSITILSHIQHLPPFWTAGPKDGRKPLLGAPFPF